QKPIGARFPEFARDLQFGVSLDSVPEAEKRQLNDLARHGLRYIFKRRETTHRNAYETIRESLARRILTQAQTHPLTELPAAELPPLDAIAPRFGAPPTLTVAATATASSRQANFVVVAGTADEMRDQHGAEQRGYGARDFREWQPYFPDSTAPIFVLAQRLATERELMVEWVPLDEHLTDALHRAQDENSVAVMVVDPRTARLPRYSQLLREFDRYAFRNCVVVIPWHVTACTREERQALRAALASALRGRFALSNACYLRPEVTSIEALEQEIAGALADLEEILAGRREPLRATPRGRFDAPPAVAATAG
ncbi:MAG: FxsC protein, partial [Pseudomonadota bacterium]